MRHIGRRAVAQQRPQAAQAVEPPPIAAAISRGRPVSVSPATGQNDAFLVDGTIANQWRSINAPVDEADGVQAAVDVSDSSAAEKANVFVLVKNDTRPSYNRPPGALGTGGIGQGRLRDYTVDVHAGAGGGAAPGITDAGWTTVVTATDNRWSERLHRLGDVGNANWVRVRATAATGPDGVDDWICPELELRGEEAGQPLLRDGWLFWMDSHGAEGFGSRNTDADFWGNTAQGAGHPAGPFDAVLDTRARTPNPAVIIDAEANMGVGIGEPGSLYWYDATNARNEYPLHIDLDEPGGLQAPVKFVVQHFGGADANGWNGDLNDPDITGGATGVDSPQAQLWKQRLQTYIDLVASQGQVYVLPRWLWISPYPWSLGNLQILLAIRAEVLADPANEGKVIAGPDLYAFFEAHRECLRAAGADTDVHPTYDKTGPVYSAANPWTEGDPRGRWDADDGDGGLTGYQWLLKLWAQWFAEFYASA